MTKEELIEILSALPNNAEVLINIGERYAEVKSVKAEYSQRVSERKPYIIVDIYKRGKAE